MMRVSIPRLTDGDQRVRDGNQGRSASESGSQPLSSANLSRCKDWTAGVAGSIRDRIAALVAALLLLAGCELLDDGKVDPGPDAQPPPRSCPAAPEWSGTITEAYGCGMRGRQRVRGRERRHDVLPVGAMTKREMGMAALEAGAYSVRVEDEPGRVDVYARAEPRADSWERWDRAHNLIKRAALGVDVHITVEVQKKMATSTLRGRFFGAFFLR